MSRHRVDHRWSSKEEEILRGFSIYLILIARRWDYRTVDPWRKGLNERPDTTAQFFNGSSRNLFRLGECKGISSIKSFDRFSHRYCSNKLQRDILRMCGDRCAFMSLQWPEVSFWTDRVSACGVMFPNSQPWSSSVYLVPPMACMRVYIQLSLNFH